MRLTTLMLITAIMQVSASGFAQKINLIRSNEPLKSVIKDLRKQSGYDFIYTESQMEKARRVNVNFNGTPIESALKELFKDQPLTYTINSSTVIINDKESSFLENALSFFDKIDVSGKIIGEDGNPLVGATIKVKGSNRFTSSDVNGNFSLKDVDENATIEVTYIGYTTIERKAAKNLGAILMSVSSAGLQEVQVVNTGYQKIQHRRTTGSVTTVGRTELEKRNTTNIMQNLEGIVPGLVQTRLRTSIRGLSTLDNTMRGILYVVDGLPIEGGIEKINPYDVESISVLKDAAAAAIYGARASNGVIVVTTRKANEVGKTVIELTGNISITEKSDYSYQNYMSPAQQVDGESEYYRWYFNGSGTNAPANPVGDFENRIASSTFITPIAYAFYQQKKGLISSSQVDAVLNDLKKNDFLQQYKDNAIQLGLTQQYNFALRTNSGRAQNSLVINYTNFNNGGNNNTTGGISTGNNLALINSFTRSLNLFYKGSYNVARWFDLDYGANGIIGKIRTHNSEWANNPSNVPAYFKLLNDDGSRNYYYTSRFNGYNAINSVSNSALSSFKFNHLDELERDFNDNSTLNSRYYINLNLRPINGLTITPMFQLEDNRSTSSTYSDAESYTMRILQNVYTTRSGSAPNYTYTNLLPKGGKLGTSEFKSTNYTARAQANYSREFGKHGIIALLGTEFRQTLQHTGTSGILLGYDDQLQTQSTNQVNFGNLYNINTGTIWDGSYPTRQYHFGQISSMGINPIETLHRYASGYVNATYTYDRKYNLFGSYRKDYADLFGGDEKYRGKPLWSVGTSWIASDESYLRDVRFINYLKVRGSYGLTGNIKNVTAFLAATTGVNPVTQVPNASVTNPPNPQLRWEKTATTNIGVDFSMVENRLRGSLDWYNRQGTDLFASKRLDPSEGFTQMTINNASMVNRGVELSLAYNWFSQKDRNGFSWSSNMTGSINNNKVTAVDELTRNPTTLASGGSFKVGYPVGSIFAFQFAGLNATGVPQWYNAAGQPSTAQLGPNDADALIYMGSEDPRYNLSLNNDIAYRGFSLSIFAIYQGGNFFRARQVPTGFPGWGYNQTPSYVLNAWTPSNTNTDVPATGQYYQVPITTQYTYSDNLVRRADFFKIRTIVLGYDLPRELASKIKASVVRIRFQVNNPNISWYRQKDVHIDPETAGAPYPTSFVFGLNANF